MNKINLWYRTCSTNVMFVNIEQYHTRISRMTIAENGYEYDSLSE